jgi:hypothetical protein
MPESGFFTMQLNNETIALVAADISDHEFPTTDNTSGKKVPENIGQRVQYARAQF